MKLILFYHKEVLKSGKILKTVLTQKFGLFECCVFHTINGLKEKFKQVCDYNEQEIYLLFVDSQARLKELTSLIDLMEDKCLILILPDESKTTLSLASRLFPRFCTKISSNYDDLCRVISKMTGNQ